MKIGDKIRIVGLPNGLQDGEMKTKSLFESCVGRIFPIVGIVPVPEIGSELLELQVGEALGHPPYMHVIWIEKEFVEVIE
jgi:hypothetical protein